MKPQRGTFIVIEGVDGVGKTTTIEHTIRALKDKETKYVRGFSQDSVWNRFVQNHPKSLFFYLDMVFKTMVIVRPSLKRGVLILQDRYVQTVDSYKPDADFLHNKIIRFVLSPLFLQPDLYINITADTEEVLARMKRDNPKEAYHQKLMKAPSEITRRKEEYGKIYNKLSCQKITIDTTNKSPEACAKELIKNICL